MLSDNREILLYGIEILQSSGWERQIARLEKISAPDRYDRVPARLFLPDGTNFIHYLIENGFARLHPRKGEPLIDPQMQRLERDARRGKRGIWNRPIYNVKSASDRHLSRQLGTYQIIEGTVTDIKRFGKVTELILDETLAVRISENLEEGLEENSRFLPAQKIAIRGWLGTFRGLVVKIDRWDQIELEP